MRIIIYSRPGMQHQDIWHGAMLHGIARTLRKGETVAREHVGSWQRSDVAVVWGEFMRQQASRHADNVLVMERGYWHDRLQFTACGWNGLNGRADFCNEGKDSTRRRRHGLHAMPWSDSGDQITIMGQVPGDMSHAHADIERYYAEAVRMLRNYPQRVYFRPHPLARGQGQRLQVNIDARESLQATLASSAFVVTFNSNSAVDAVLAGVPVVVADPGSMAWQVAGHELTAPPPMPDREQWLNELAWCQWNMPEIESGEAWVHLRDYATGGDAC